MLAGIGVSVVVGIVGYFVARFINRRHYHLSINVLEQQQTAEVPDLSVNAQQTRLPPPNALVIGGLIVVPIMLIVSGTLCQALLLPENAVRQLMTVIGTAGRPADLHGHGQLDAGHPSADEPEKAGRSHRQRDPLVGGRDPRRRRRRRLWRRTGRFRHR